MEQEGRDLGQVDHHACRPAARAIVFPGGGHADLVDEVGDPVAELTAIGLLPGEPRPVILVCGGADDLTGDALAHSEELLAPALRYACSVTGAVLVDGGTASGIMAVAGRARIAHELDIPVLLGVAPAGLVTEPERPAPDRVALEGHHTHFVLADADRWGGETDLLLELAATIAGDEPVAVVVAGGGNVTRSEVLQAAGRGWPLVVLDGTGGVADALAGLVPDRRPHAHGLARLRPHRTPPPSAMTATLENEIPSGTVRRATTDDPHQLGREIAWELQDDPALKSAWRSFATLDRTAARLRTNFERLQGSILALGVIATLLALVQQSIGGTSLHWPIVVAPGLASMLIALANRRASGRRWILLRTAAEEIKSEIYRYRAGTGAYRETSGSAGEAFRRRTELVARLDAIEARLMQTEAMSGALTPYRGSLPPTMYGASRADDGLSRLSADQYLRTRVADQLSYYLGRVDRLDRRRLILQFIALSGGGVGAVLAAAGFEIWIGLTTVVSSAALAATAYLQVDSTIVGYNQSAGRLLGLSRAWTSHGPQPDAGDDAKDTLVAACEHVMVTELSSWVQQMDEALQELRRDQATAAKARGRGEP